MEYVADAHAEAVAGVRTPALAFCARDLRPALTTVHVPYEEPGRLAARTALGRTPESAAEQLCPGTHVVAWDSVAAPARQPAPDDRLSA
ncbi:hypothetical protein ACYF6T_13590 [Streptomyces sp. 7R007]